MVRKPSFIQTAIYSLLILIWVSPALAQDNDACASARKLKAFLDEKHVAPQHSEAFAEDVTKSLVLSLDVNGLYFTQADLDGPLADLKNLETAIAADQCDYLKTLRSFLAERLARLDTLISQMALDEVAAKGIYNPAIQSLGDLEADLPALALKWKHYIKYQLFERKYLQSSEEVLQADNLAMLFEDVMASERCKLLKKTTLLKEEEDFIPKVFYSALAQAFDPHTNYYQYGFVEMLTAFMQEDEPSFGFQLVENRFGQISIGKLLPGGPAWRSNQLHVGDVVTMISRKNGKELDLTCTRLDEVKRHVAFSGESIDLTVLSTSKEEKRVTLVKEKLTSTTNAVRGYVLNGEKKVGYIALPDFYTSEGEEEDDERGCARDVAREIIKLNNDGIEGLMIDVRNNGGGSLQEALDLIGIFIEEGPLALMKKEGKIRVIGDRSRGAAYFGPLIILVNGQSASASELLAASLQDYNRALIVGDTTFGKAVGQVMEVLKDDQKEDEFSFKAGIVKVTTSRIFRLKGQSYQQEGVVPDIYVPELLINNTESEGSYPFAINREDIDRDTYFKPYPTFPLARLRTRHQQRLEAEGIWKAKSLTNQIRESRENLSRLEKEDFLKVRSLKAEKQAWLAGYFKEGTKPFTAANHAFDQMIINMSNQKKQIEMMTFSELENNLYIRQAYQIMTDLINSTK